jgi:hypothetical protein
MAWHVYILRDPRDNAVRYVGSTTRPEQRLANHMREDVNAAKAAWVAELVAVGLQPALEIVETHAAPPTLTVRRERERHWVLVHVAAGAELLNVALTTAGVKSQRTSASMEKRVTAGKCRRCGGPRGESRSAIKCEPCLDMERAEDRARREARKTIAGRVPTRICGNCGARGHYRTTCALVTTKEVA